MRSLRPSNPISLLALGGLAVAGAVVAALGPQGAAGSVPTLYVNYTMSCTFNMTDAMGRPLTAIPPGAYQILVTSPVPFASVDLAGINDMTACKGSADFQLTGPGVAVTTTLDDGDSDSVVVYGTFQPSSTYAAVDTAQPSVAHFTFTTTATGTAGVPVTAPAAGTTTTAKASSPTLVSPPISSRTRGRLTATVEPGGRANLTFGGKAVTALTPGNYTFVVTDRSPRDGFVLRRPGKKLLWVTTRAFVGRHVKTVDLTKGTWSFEHSATGVKSSFRVG